MLVTLRQKKRQQKQISKNLIKNENKTIRIKIENECK